MKIINKIFLYFKNFPIIIIVLLLSCNLNYNLTSILTEKDNQIAEQSVRYSFIENFDDGDISNWQHGSEYTSYVFAFPIISPTTTRCLAITTLANVIQMEGIYRNIGKFSPKYISLYTRVDTNNSGNYFILSNDHNYSNRTIYFWFDGTYLVFNDTQYYTCTLGTWYHIEFRNINWTTHTYDLYINGSEFALNKSFHAMPSNVDGFNCMDIYGSTNFTTWYIDDINMHL